MKNRALLKATLFPWLICGLGALFYSYEYLLRMSPSVMQENLMRFYNLTGTQFGYLSGSFYYLMYVAMQIMVGLLMDRFGPRRLLTVACFLCASGAFLFACSSYFSVAIAGRFLIGFGSAFAFVGAAKLATIWLPPHRFALVSGIIFCLGMLGAMFGDTVLRVLVDTINWQVAIYAAAAGGIVISMLIWLVVRDVNPFYSDHHSHHTPNLQQVLSGLWQALGNSQIWLCGLVGCLMYFFLYCFAEYCAPAYLEQARGLSRLNATGATSMVFLGCAIGAPLLGWFSDYLGRRRLPIMLAAIGALVVISLLLYTHDLSLKAIYILLFAYGFLSSAQILMFAIAREVTPIKISGTAVGLLNMLIMVGGIFFPPIIGKLLDLNWAGTMLDGARVYSIHAYTMALSVLPIALALSIVSMLSIKETYCKIQVDEHPQGDDVRESGKHDSNNIPVTADAACSG